ncbi:MAG: hypothetical protein J6J97_07875 [Akkermansia sp.]|nr:hypothetical protein [Akkermansia sp.]MBQ8900547.1 hypothetical protein [Akkermansia sp.]
MTRVRLILILILLSVLASVALLLPGWFKDPRELVQGEWQEFNKLGYVEVTDCTARWRGGNYRGTFHYQWLQDDSEPYSIEISRNEEKYLVSLTFESDDLAVVDFHIIDKLPPEAREFIRQKNKARNRPEDELKLRFKRVQSKK